MIWISNEIQINTLKKKKLRQELICQITCYLICQINVYEFKKSFPIKISILSHCGKETYKLKHYYLNIYLFYYSNE